METWNPDSGTVSTIVSQLPQESSSSFALNSFTMFSIKNNSELLLLGGYLGTSHLSGANFWTRKCL